jgi:hypothetical protein
MLVIGLPWTTKPVVDAADAPVPGDLRFQRKPQVGKEP